MRERQADAQNVALSRALFAVTQTMDVVAHYFVTTDNTDGDGIPDWYEWQQYGTLLIENDSDTDQDGFSLLDEYRLDQLMQDDAAMEAFAKHAAIGVWHASCTCRMGAADDPMAVTDNQGRVRHVEGLRVVDASIFPIVPTANINIPTFLAAEKIADAILTGD